MKLAYMADSIAAGLFDPAMVYAAPNSLDLRAIRDACDNATYGELSTSQLDNLTRMVEWRLEYRPRKWVEKYRGKRDNFPRWIS